MASKLRKIRRVVTVQGQTDRAKISIKAEVEVQPGALTLWELDDMRESLADQLMHVAHAVPRVGRIPLSKMKVI